MEEVLIIRIANSDGSAFLSIINALQDKNLQILHAADLEPSTLTLGDIEIFPESASVYGVVFCHYKKLKCEEKKGNFTFLDEVLMISPR